MKRILMIASLAVSLASFAGVASAQDLRGPRAMRLDAREQNQERRIRQGWRNGELTPMEYRRLQMGERRIRAFERHARADGQFTPAERVRLARMEDRESRMIARFRHNERQRGA